MQYTQLELISFLLCAFVFVQGTRATYWICDEFKCKNGTRIRNPDFIPSPNGCGSAKGWHISYQKCTYLNDCCNSHDWCYGTCGSARSKCDESFKECVSSITNLPPKTSKLFCKASGLAMYSAVFVGGCPAFKNAQKKACSCQNHWFDTSSEI